MSDKWKDIVLGAGLLIACLLFAWAAIALDNVKEEEYGYTIPENRASL